VFLTTLPAIFLREQYRPPEGRKTLPVVQLHHYIGLGIARS